MEGVKGVVSEVCGVCGVEAGWASPSSSAVRSNARESERESGSERQRQ